jgi:hypothetical protein
MRLRRKRKGTQIQAAQMSQVVLAVAAAVVAVTVMIPALLPTLLARLIPAARLAPVLQAVTPLIHQLQAIHPLLIHQMIIQR